MQAMGQCLNVGSKVRDLLVRVIDFLSGADLGSRKGASQDLQVQRQQGNALTDVIVQFPCDVRSLCFLRFHQLAADTGKSLFRQLSLGDIGGDAQRARLAMHLNQFG